MYCKLLLLKLLLLVAVYTHQDEIVLDDAERELEAYDDGHEEGNDFSDIWAVQLAHGSNPDEVARINGLRNKGAIFENEGYFEFVHNHSRLRKRSRGHDKRVQRSLSNHPHVRWFERQRYLKRVKRSSIPLEFNDPLLPYQWYVHNTGQYNSGLKGFDLNILPVWQMGYTGKGVKVAVLDDGLDHTHPDLKANYDPKASYDFNGEDEDPFPRDSDQYNAHGTKCSGEIAAVANNSICGVGIAFNANIGGVRMLDGKATDSLEAKSLGFRNDYIDIYSCSWGPKDDGKTYGRPGKLARSAFVKGARKGRQGKGNIYVWATGNGGLVGDDCDCDGYTTSIYTLSFGAISDHGLSTYYDEKCSSTLAVVFTADSHRGSTFTNDKLITTGLHHACETTFRGTSSAAPLAAGIIALVLEANSNLTWRDVQHIVVNTAKKTSPMDEGWKRNAAGLQYNHKFGFGRLDALAMVKAAITWVNVPPQHICHVSGKSMNVPIHYRDTVELKLSTMGCKGQASEVRKLEHVDVTLTLRHRRRGDLNITVVSPNGTKSNLLSPRRFDISDKGLKDWAFMTVHLWGEDPSGTWSLYIRDQGETFPGNSKEDNEDRYRKLLDEKKANRARNFIPGAYDFMHDEVHHGRYKEDYMRDEVPEDPEQNPWNFNEDVLEEDNISSRKSTPAGFLLNWSVTFYGTDH